MSILPALDAYRRGELDGMDPDDPLDERTVCDSCGDEIRSGETVNYNLWGEGYCDGCAEDAPEQFDDHEAARSAHDDDRYHEAKDEGRLP